ncbi:hypothetical protein BDC45DRAFT_534155 [Circinella umbellata]|nr:hypothetical protein BDC45DRAFT_534154 [Circinella umbellata]KAI7855817.1 hypothetical protein BDC45DRAFT_534155 [Circinella umbellata]
MAIDGADALDITMCDLVFEGRECHVYLADHKFDGMYRCIELGSFFIPKDRYNFDALFGVFKIMNMLRASDSEDTKDVVIGSAKLCMDSIQSSEEYDKLGMVLDSFESPVRLGEQQYTVFPDLKD